MTAATSGGGWCWRNQRHEIENSESTGEKALSAKADVLAKPAAWRMAAWHQPAS